MSSVALLREMFRYNAWANAEFFAKLELLGADHGEARHVAIRQLNHCLVVNRIFKAHLTGQPHGYAADNTPESVQYEDVVKFRQSLLGTQFFKNRVDYYRLKPDDPKGPLPKNHGESEVDVRITPVRATAVSVLAIRGECSDTDPARPCDCPADGKCGVLYVGAGSLDRVSAYALFANGKMGRTPFDMTDEQTGSFPNDVAVVVLPAGESCIE